jgi:hypothetical protein
VLERALRARTEALDLQGHLLAPDAVHPSGPGTKSIAARG